MDKFLEDIRQTEEAGSIKTTRDYIRSRKLEPPQPLTSKVFRPSVFFKFLVLCVFAVIPGFVIFRIFQPKPLTDNEIGGIIDALVGLAIIIPQGVRQFFLNKEMNFTIRIDHIGISIDDTTYPWETIYETAIMTKAGGGSRYNYLVIALNNFSTYEPFELSNFFSLNPFGFAITLAKYIEYLNPIRNRHWFRYYFKFFCKANSQTIISFLLSR